ncbi:MAG: cyclic nucleotide-binding domain-containing protein [Paracoccaceae bacterium]|nr:cyclic nucleotide-binding domain-containing protein [Paracoccaceae bacterium]
MESILKGCRGRRLERFKEGEDLIREGSRLGHLFVLEQGEIEVRKGMVEVFRSRSPGTIFGEMGALLDVPHTATVTAATPVRAYRIEDPADFLRSDPEIALHAATILARRLHSATNYLADLKEQNRATGAELSAVNDMMEMLLQQPAVEELAAE